MKSKPSASSRFAAAGMKGFVLLETHIAVVNDGAAGFIQRNEVNDSINDSIAAFRD